MIKHVVVTLLFISIATCIPTESEYDKDFYDILKNELAIVDILSAIQIAYVENFEHSFKIWFANSKTLKNSGIESYTIWECFSNLEAIGILPPKELMQKGLVLLKKDNALFSFLNDNLSRIKENTILQYIQNLDIANKKLSKRLKTTKCLIRASKIGLD